MPDGAVRTAVLRLVVVANENETVSDECLISSITRLPEEKQAEGYVKKSASFYRGASRDSQIRNTAGAGQRLTVFGLCGDFYRVRLPADYDFEDTLNQETAYALKSDIEIPVTLVSITNGGEAEHMQTGEQIKLETLLLPELASRKNLTWKSSNEKVAQVDSDGTVTAQRAGNARITVTETYSGVSASCPVQVSHSMPGAAVAKGTVKLDIEVASDYGGNHVVWYSLGNMDEYRLYIGTWDKKKKKIVYKKHRVLEDRYYHKKAKKGVTYYYYVQGISEGRIAGKSKRVKLKAAMPQLTVTTQSLSSLKLDWTTGKEKKVKKFSEYQLYRSSKKKGMYKKIKTIRKKGVHTWTDIKRKSGTTYYYKVVLYQKKQGKRWKKRHCQKKNLHIVERGIVKPFGRCLRRRFQRGMRWKSREIHRILRRVCGFGPNWCSMRKAGYE
ncbi:MAG: Ig domain-containing protein [Lachnospiraceae bacterium]|nr:Ig domain-containing protein [Lachnospiraceae bacterium]